MKPLSSGEGGFLTGNCRCDGTLRGGLEGAVISNLLA